MMLLHVRQGGHMCQDVCPFNRDQSGYVRRRRISDRGVSLICHRGVSPQGHMTQGPKTHDCQLTPRTLYTHLYPQGAIVSDS